MLSKFVNFVSIDLKISTRISMATKYPIIKHRAFFKKICRGHISPINTWRILMKLRKEIPVCHAYFVLKSIEHRSKVMVKVIKHIKPLFEPYFLTGSRREFWLVSKWSWSKYLWEISKSHHDVWHKIKHTILHVFQTRQICADWSKHRYTHWLDLYYVFTWQPNSPI